MRAALLLMNVGLNVADGEARGVTRVGSGGGAAVAEGTR
jgi:hypothetical protein